MAETKQNEYEKEREFLRSLLVACEKDELETIKGMEESLKSKNISVCDYRDGRKAGAVHAAARGGSRNVLEYLLSLKPEQGGLKDADDRTPLLAACSSDDGAECVRYLLEKSPFAKATVSLVSGGAQCIHHAACLSSSKTLEYLINLGSADPNAPSSAGTPLHWAAAHADTEDTTQYLLKCGVDVNALDPSGCTALIMACLRGKVPIVRTLCQAGVNLEIYANNISALSAAAVAGQKECVEVILAKGGNSLCLRRDPVENLLPIEHAAHAGRSGIVALLATPSKMPGINPQEFVQQTQEEYARKQAKEVEEQRKADAQANAIKEEGNKLFLEKNYLEAIQKYDTAAQVPKISPSVKATLLSNSSASHLKAGNFDTARKIAEKACEADPKFTKALFRLGQACNALKDHESAAHAYYAAYDVDKTSKEAGTYLNLFKEQVELGKKAYEAQKKQ